jgi:hypothetical protein
MKKEFLGLRAYVAQWLNRCLKDKSLKQKHTKRMQVKERGRYAGKIKIS